MGFWIPPARGRFTDDYGPRDTGIPGASKYHRGVDIAPPYPGQKGVPVFAVHAGVVIANGWSRVRGWWIMIRHADGSATRSQHLAARGVAQGTRVATGQIVGTIGKTGVSRGEHLHFETFNPGANWSSSTNAVDPESFMKARGVSLRSGVRVNSPFWKPNGMPRVTGTQKKVIDMFVTRYGSTAYRLVTAAGVVGISKSTYDRLVGSGIPAPAALDNAELKSIERQLNELNK